MDNVIPKIISTGLPINTTYLGRGASSHFQSNAGLNLTIIDEVPYVQPYLTSSDLGIVPLFYESGTRFKILEYGISNLPIVSTTLGQEGFNLKDRVDYFVLIIQKTFFCYNRTLS